MESNWAFLEPKLAVLRDYSLKRGFDVAKVSVAFASPRPPVGASRHDPTEYFLKLPMDAPNRQNRGRLQRLREATELFTMLAIVDSKAFSRILLQLGDPFSACRRTPKWKLVLVGVLPREDPAAFQSPVSWATLLGVPDDPWDYSSSFREAMYKLTPMDVDDAVKWVDSYMDPIVWEINDATADLVGTHEFDETSASSSSSSELKPLFDAGVPPIFQVAVCQNTGIATEHFLLPETIIVVPPSLAIKVERLTFGSPGISDLAWLLAQTATEKLSFRVYEWNGDPVVKPQVLMNAGYFLSLLLCGSSLCDLAVGDHTFRRTVRGTSYDELDLECSEVPDSIFAATCSAVSELTWEGTVNGIEFSQPQRMSQHRLAWVVYALYCGRSTVCMEKAAISNIYLTQSAIASVEAVMKTKYPEPILDEELLLQPEYGFADLAEGARVQPAANEEVDFVLSQSCRCRALSNPEVSPGWIEFLVPAYGICITELKDAVVEFFPDTTEHKGIDGEQLGRVQTLDLDFEKVETGSLVTDLLALIGRCLQTLTLGSESTVEQDYPLSYVDLSVLAEVCPVVENLEIIYGFNVSVSTYNEALRKWPIKKITVFGTSTLPDLGPCLSDCSYRLAQELVMLDVGQEDHGERFSLDEMVKLTIHDQEFLPVVKEKFPLKSKAALLSVWEHENDPNGPTKGRKAIQRLAEVALRLLFGFASTPEQRSVRINC